jgi:hypothetical protein
MLGSSAMAAPTHTKTMPAAVLNAGHQFLNTGLQVLKPLARFEDSRGAIGSRANASFLVLGARRMGPIAPSMVAVGRG